MFCFKTAVKRQSLRKVLGKSQESLIIFMFDHFGSIFRQFSMPFYGAFVGVVWSTLWDSLGTLACKVGQIGSNGSTRWGTMHIHRGVTNLDAFGQIGSGLERRLFG